MRKIELHVIAEKHNIVYTDDVNNYTLDVIDAIGLDNAFLTDDEKCKELKHATERIEWLEKRNDELCEEYRYIKESNLEVHRNFNNLKEKYSIESLRDKFAGLAMQGLLASNNNWSEDDIAMSAYEQADAMLKERSKSDE
jgi:hypothetical protein